MPPEFAELEGVSCVWHLIGYRQPAGGTTLVCMLVCVVGHVFSEQSRIVMPASELVFKGFVGLAWPSEHYEMRV